MRTAIRTKNFFMQTIKHANVDQTLACLKSTKPQLLFVELVFPRIASPISHEKK